MANKVILVGNVGRDPEIHHTSNGDPIANFSVATSERWKDKSGQKQEKTEWHRIVVFGKLAEIVEKYVKKGTKLYVEGKLQTRKWTDNAGVEKYTTEVVLDFNGKMEMLSSKGESHDVPSDDSQPAQAEPQAKAKPATTPDDAFDDDIPF